MTTHVRRWDDQPMCVKHVWSMSVSDTISKPRRRPTDIGMGYPFALLARKVYNASSNDIDHSRHLHLSL